MTCTSSNSIRKKREVTSNGCPVPWNWPLNWLATSFRSPRERWITPPVRSFIAKSATVNFGGTCPYQNKTGVDGCVQTPAEWKAIDKRTGLSETSIGTDQTTAVYRESRWWLCDSNFNGTTTRPFSTFIR